MQYPTCERVKIVPGQTPCSSFDKDDHQTRSIHAPRSCSLHPEQTKWNPFSLIYSFKYSTENKIMSSHLEHPYELPHSIRGSLKPFHSCFPWSLSSCQNLSKVSLLRTFTPVVYKNIQFYNNDNSKDVWRYSNMHSTSNHALMILPCLSRPKHKFIHGTVLVVLYII